MKQTKMCSSGVYVSCDNGLMQYQAGAFRNKPPLKGSGAATGTQKELSAPSVCLLMHAAS